VWATEEGAWSEFRDHSSRACQGAAIPILRLFDAHPRLLQVGLTSEWTGINVKANAGLHTSSSIPRIPAVDFSPSFWGQGREVMEGPAGYAPHRTDTAKSLLVATRRA
jgi:hypothetical protein